MRYSIRTVTPAVEGPVSLAEAKAHLRIEADDVEEDDLIAAQLAAAVDWVERHTSQILSERVMEMVMDRFPLLPELIVLPREPVTAIVSITYTDADGVDVPMDPADYRWSESSADLVRPAFRAAWPVAAVEAGSVRVRFTAGYGAGLAPGALTTAVKMLLGHLYRNRSALGSGPQQAVELPLGVTALCAPYRKVLL